MTTSTVHSLPISLSILLCSLVSYTSSVLKTEYVSVVGIITLMQIDGHESKPDMCILAINQLLMRAIKLP